MGPKCFFPGSFLKFQGSGVGGLPDNETVCDVEMAAVLFGVMNISHQRQSLVLQQPDVVCVLAKVEEMQGD